MPTQYNRRDLILGIAGGAVSLALAPSVYAQLGPPPGKVSLRWNENPYGPSAGALEAAEKAAALGAYYAVGVDTNLRQAIASRNDLALENVVLASGSNEALHAALVAWGKKGKVALPSLTYTGHLAYSRRMGVEMVPIPLQDDLSIDLDGIAASVDDSVSLVYICNPNNPTGLILDGDTLRDFCRTVGKKAVVVIDEAYNEITDHPESTSMIDLVREGENVIVMRTFSKIFGMAGLRVRYGMARPDLANTIAENIMTWPNVVGLSAALASYTDDEFIKFSRSKVHEGRKMVNDTFLENGITPVPSQTNFVYADIGRDATKFQKQMAERNVLIRGSFDEKYPNHTRVSMGKIEDIKVFQKVFTEVFNA